MLNKIIDLFVLLSTQYKCMFIYFHHNTIVTREEGLITLIIIPVHLCTSAPVTLLIVPKLLCTCRSFPSWRPLTDPLCSKCWKYISTLSWALGRAASDPSVLNENAPSRDFSWLKVPPSAFTFKTQIRHYAKQVPKHGK